MSREAFKHYKVTVDLLGYEMAFLDGFAEQEGYPTPDALVETLLRETILDHLDSEEVPFLPARAYYRKKALMEQENKNGTDPD